MGIEPEGLNVEVMTIAPGGITGVLEEPDADNEAETEAGEDQELLLELDGDLSEDA